MKYIVEIYEENEIEIAKQHGVDGIVIPIEFYSAHQENVFQFNELDELCAKAKGFDIYLDASRMYVDEELNRVYELVKKAHELHVTGIYFADMSLYQICHELGYDSLGYYQPDTMLVNSQDVNFYRKRMGGVCLAKELTIDEIVTICENTNGQVEVFLHGRPLMSMSKRPLVQNYFNHIHHDGNCNGIYYLKEEQRQERFPVLTNEQGTFFFATYVQQSFKELERLIQVNTKQGKISHFSLSFSEMMDAVDVYKQIEKEGYKKQEESFLKKYAMQNYTTGFYYLKTSVKKEG